MKGLTRELIMFLNMLIRRTLRVVLNMVISIFKKKNKKVKKADSKDKKSPMATLKSASESVHTLSAILKELEKVSKKRHPVEVTKDKK